MPAIFSTVGRAALALGRRAASSVLTRIAGRRAALTVEQRLAARLTDIKKARKAKVFDFAQWILGQGSRGEDQPKTLAQREETMVNHMSIWLALGLIIFILYSFFTNVISNAPIPSGAL
ncbi:MAG: hypothetical protein NUV98_04650 [Candidatus Roizmanbacteria bacterium]|nr:hypothetical protein [Candidatus Roizmanbacteria bacterium]